MTGTVAAITSYLKSIHIKVLDEWVEACIDWLQEEHQSSGDHLSLDKIKKLVYEQWLVADLTELGMQYLPPQVATAEKYSLSGHYCLQVNSMIDISMSYYAQQVKLKGIDNTNSKITFDEPKKPTWQPPHTRMFKLELTDGTTKVYAMEYNTIPDLKSDFKPGFKVLIKGNILCRKGMLMLKKENIQVLGGEVDCLMETNTNAQLLTKAMESSASYAGECKRREFTAADAVKFADRISAASKKKGSDLPGMHNNTYTSGNSSRFIETKNKSWNSAHKTESWKSKCNNLKAMSTETNMSVDDFQDEWEADDLDDDFLIAASQESSSLAQNLRNSNADETPRQQQQNKKRSFSPYEINDTSVLPRKKTSRLTPTTSNIQDGLSPASGFDDSTHCVDNWDDDEMEMAMAMDADLYSRCVSKAPAKESSSAGCAVTNKPGLMSDRAKKDCSPITLSSSSSSSSSSRPCQLSGSLVKPPSQSDQIIKLSIETRSESTKITANSSPDDILKKFFELCKQKTNNANAYSDLMKVEPKRLPFTYLFVLQECQLPENASKFRLKGYVSTLLGKLERADHKWKLMCMLNDGTGTLPVQLSNEVLVQLIGFTVQQSIEMTGPGVDPSLKKKLQEGVKQCQLKLVNLSSIFEIETNQNYTHPLVTKITSINAGHIQQLRRQLTGALEKV